MIQKLRDSLTDAGQPILLGLGFGVLVAINISSLWLLTRAQSAQEQVRHTLEVDRALLDLQRTLRRAESAQRGYLLTLQSVYLDDYRATVKELPERTTEIRGQIVDNPLQARALDELERHLSARIKELDDVLRIRDESGIEAAIDAIRQRDSLDYIGGARSAAQRMINEEERLLWSRTAQAERTVLYLFVVSLAGSLVILLLGGASLLLVRRSNRQRDEANARLAAANYDLEQAIAERTAELEEAYQELQRYAYIVSHDLRSPLVNIMGFTTELEELRDQLFDTVRRRTPGADAPVQDEADLRKSYDEALDFIKASITRMDNLIHAILRLSREGQRQFKPETIDMTEFMESIASSLAHQIEEAGAEISVEILPSLVSDRLALEQIFSNLLDNAVKYLAPGRPGRITVRGREVLGHAVFEIEDNGRGIPQKDHSRIFDLFRRSGVQDKPGDGIGLAHVRALVRRLGGRISVKSEAGAGSVFTVTLPLQGSPARERSAA